MKNKILLFLLVGIISLSFNSCTNNNEEKLTEKELINHLKKLNNNFIFTKINSDSNINAKNNLPEPIYFKSLEELDQFLQNFGDFDGSQPTTGNYLLTDYFDESGGGSSNNYYKETRSIGLFTNMNISFNTNNCRGTNLQSWISGFTLGVSYNHMGGSLTTTNNKINYTVDGILNYNIFVEGVGTVFSENLSFSGSYQCN